MSKKIRDKGHLFRVLSRKEKWGEPAKRELPGKPEITVEATFLCQDIHSLEIVIPMLRGIDVSNVTEDREFGYQMMRAVIMELRLCQRYAKLKLRKILAP